MNFHFTLRIANIVVSGATTIDPKELDNELIQRMIDTERFLELVLKKEVNFEVTTSEGPISISKMDRLLDQDRESRDERR